jgi:hypothetical protein
VLDAGVALVDEAVDVTAGVESLFQRVERQSLRCERDTRWPTMRRENTPMTNAS